MTADFPIADRNHTVSQASKRLFTIAAPLSWVPTELGGDDFGFDYQVQVNVGGQVRNAFRLQLKGTESLAASTDGSLLKISLGRRTLNLYANTQDEVMLVLVLVKFDDRGEIDVAGSRMYWQWIGAELERLRGSRYGLDLSTVESTTVHVPASHALTQSLDVVEHLEERMRQARAMESLATLVRDSETLRNVPGDPLQKLISLVQDKPGLLSALTDSEGEPPTQGSEGTDGLLSEAHALIRAGRTSLAEAVIERMDRSEFDAKPKLRASYLSALGKVAMHRRKRADALQFFEEAYATDSIEKHLLAREEVKLLVSVDSNDVAAMVSIADQLSDVRTDDGLSLLARVQVGLQRFDQASGTVARISVGKRLVPRLVVLSGERKWDEIGSVASIALQSGNLSLYDAIACRLIAARGAWQRALKTATQGGWDGEEFPLSGPVGLDFEAAHEAWALSSKCLQDLRETGWPPNTELLTPVAVASACAVGAQSEALRLMREAAEARPEYIEVQRDLELIAISANNSEVALEANLRQPVEHALLVRRCCLYFQLNKYAECLRESLAALSSLDQAVQQTPMALAMGSAAAVKLSRPLDRDRLMAAIERRAEWGEFIYFARFGQDSIEGSKPQLAALREGVIAFPHSILLASNLFMNLPVGEEATAREALTLYRAMRRYRTPTMEDSQKAISALLTTSAWQDAEAEARLAVRHFGPTGRLLSMLAVALEMQGRTGDAVALLEEALQSDEGRHATLRNYLGLMLRMGRMREAREAIEALLARETDRSERLELQRLKALILAQEGCKDEAYATVLRIGEEVNREVETEEGMYINLYMAVTLHRVSLPEDAAKAFSERVEAFCTTWPQSKLFRRASLPDHERLSSDDLHNLLDTLVGDSRERMREYLDRERKARSGEFPVPFVARPGFVLHYIGDVFVLWEVAKQSKPEDRQYHLTCFLPGEEPVTAMVLRDIPLLDLTALLVLHDLGCIETLFRLFPRIAIPRETVDYISQNARHFLPGSAAAPYAERLLNFINSNIDRIDQPSPGIFAVKRIRTGELLSDYVALAKTGRWAVYSDDAFTRAWVRHDEPSVKALTTVDLLRLADDEGFLTSAEVARHVVTLASWNVTVSVSPRYLIATLDGAGENYKQLSPSGRLDLFHAHAPFATLARALWRVDKQPNELIQHMAALLAETLKNPLTDEDSVAAVWAFWYLRVKLFQSMSQLSVELLCLCLMTALQMSPPALAPRLVRTMLKVVEIAEAERMSTQKRDDALRALGASVASLAARGAAVGDQIRAKVVLALPERTHEGDIFSAAYVDGLKSAHDVNRQQSR
jgi:tetratricopeptide (TPR) repeat protein